MRGIGTRPAPSRYRCFLRTASKLAALIAAGALTLPLVLQRTAAPASAQDADPAFVDRVVASLTADEVVGQLVMVNFVGDDVSAQADIASLIRDFKVGSVIVTSSNGNIVNRDDTPTQTANLTNGLQQRAFEASRRS